MYIEGLTNYQFYISLGYVTLVASLLTMLSTQIIKVILKKKKVIKEDMNESEKDMILSRIGRISALFFYALLYILNEFFLKHTVIINNTLIAGLLSGSALTLTTAKGIYTMLHQHFKKKTIYEQLEYSEQIIEALEKELCKSTTSTHVITNKRKEG